MKSDSLQAEKSAIETRPGSAVEEKPQGRHTQVITEVIPMTPFLKNQLASLAKNIWEIFSFKSFHFIIKVNNMS